MPILRIFNRDMDIDPVDNDKPTWVTRLNKALGRSRSKLLNNQRAQMAEEERIQRDDDRYAVNMNKLNHKLEVAKVNRQISDLKDTDARKDKRKDKALHKSMLIASISSMFLFKLFEKAKTQQMKQYLKGLMIEKGVDQNSRKTIVIKGKTLKKLESLGKNDPGTQSLIKSILENSGK